MKSLKIFFIFLSLLIANDALRCWKCDNASSNEQCKEKGKVEECKEYQGACESVVRRGSFGELITKRCKEVHACDNNFKQNEQQAWFPRQCNDVAPNSVCRCCCNFDECNADSAGCSAKKQRDEAKFSSCLALEPPANGEMSCSSKRLKVPTKGRNEVETECTFTCNKGYVIKGASSSRCQQKYRFRRAKFSNPTPTCVARTCPARHTAMDNGHVLCTDDNRVSSVCLFACRSGYVIEGSSMSTCQSSLSWSDPPASCIPPLCDPPHRDPIHGSVTCSDSNRSGSQCRFDCHRGYVMDGSPSSSCTHSTSGILVWSNQPPACLPATCGPPPPLTKGGVNCSMGNMMGSVCTYTCASGYFLDGISDVTCIADVNEDVTGFWSSNPGQCRAMFCPPLAVPKHGVMKCIGWGEVGTQCTSSCNPGYFLVGKSVSVCEPVSKRKARFNHPTPSCAAATCGPPPPLTKGGVNCSMDNMMGSVCTYTCASGYFLDGISDVTCIADVSEDVTGVWSSYPGRCTALWCPSMRVAGNGTMTCLGWGKVGTRCTSSCNPGFVLIGESVSFCAQVSDKKARFNNPTPNCVEKEDKKHS